MISRRVRHEGLHQIIEVRPQVVNHSWSHLREVDARPAIRDHEHGLERCTQRRSDAEIQIVSRLCESVQLSGS